MRAAHTGKCVGVRGGQTATGTLLDQSPCVASANQFFTIKPANGGYNLFDNNSAKCVRIKDSALTDGAEATLGLCDYYARDAIFNFIESDRGFFQLANLNSGKCLSVKDGSNANGAEVVQMTCGGPGDSDKFYFAGALTGPIPPCEDQFCGYYYDEVDFKNLVIARNEVNRPNYDFQGGSPDPTIGEDTFSIYYVGQFTFEDGNYLFTVETDDGIRLIVDGVTVIDQYFDQAPQIYTVTLPMTAGFHKVEIYYYENGGGAVIRADWVKQ